MFEGIARTKGMSSLLEKVQEGISDLLGGPLFRGRHGCGCALRAETKNGRGGLGIKVGMIQVEGCGTE